jgi:hypothetical protein
MTQVLEQVLLTTLTQLDALRAALLRLCGAPGRNLLRDRQARVALSGALGVVTSLAFSTLAPLLLLTLGPLLLGVPHLVADLRYMVARQGLHRRRGFWLLVAPCLALCVLQPRLCWGSCAVAGAVLAARAPIAARLAMLVPCAGLTFAAQRLGPRADVLFAHAHNLMALALWVAWARAAKQQVLPALALYALGGALIFGGVAERVLFEVGTLDPSRLAIDAGLLVPSLSPVEHPLWGLRWLLFFAFSQSLHYLVWLRLIPDEARERPGIRPFAASYRALRAELGPWLLGAGLAATLGLLALALRELPLARNLYLQLALFHGPLEIAVAVLLWLERRTLAPSAP